MNLYFLKGAAEGVLGGLMFLAFNSWRSDYQATDHLKNKVVTRIILGAGIGYIWVTTGMPNSFNTVMAGALAPEVIEGTISRFKDKIKNKELPLPLDD